jgi:hypothetical protein
MNAWGLRYALLDMLYQQAGSQVSMSDERNEISIDTSLEPRLTEAGVMKFHR